MTKYDLIIIIVTYNSEKYIGECIDSIMKSENGVFNYKIIIIDNNSKDKTINIIKEKQKENNRIFLIKNNKNIGFAKGVNQGILKNKNYDYILLLNPDTILKKNSIKNLIKCSEENHAGISGGSTFDINGKESGSYFRFPNLMVGIFDFSNLRKLCKGDKWHKYFYYLNSKRNMKSSFPVDVVTGGFMLFSHETIKRTGLFDESFFMYLEDVDYCLRAKKAGIKIFHTNRSRIMHIGGASSKNKDKVRHSSWLKSRKIYFFKHFGFLANLIIQPLFLIDDILILFKKSLSKKQSHPI